MVSSVKNVFLRRRAVGAHRSCKRLGAGRFASASELLFLLETVRYLVDPASSHMLVSKIKPCMSKYKLLYGETADGSLKQLLFT